jgi:hypothetical protein
MSVSIITCPSCTTLLLSDTVQCPTCLHVLDDERAAQFPIERRATTESASEGEDACPVCGEMVRHGLVRCWSCGSFMKQEIAETYQKLQEDAPAVEFSELPEIDQFTAQPSRSPDRQDTLLADDDDFELSPEFSLRPGAEEPERSPEDTYALTAAATSTAEDPSHEGAPTSVPAAADPQETPSAGGETGSPITGNGDASGARLAPDVPEIDHSVATGGDVLLKVALAELAEEERRRAGGPRRGQTAARRGGFLIYCPNGHRIEVQEKHRGLQGRCPKCKAPFVVPPEPPPPEPAPAAPAAGAAAAEAAAPAASAGQTTRWMDDVHLHAVKPQMLKLKPGSLKAAFDEVDLGFSEDGLLFVQLVKKGGLFGPDKKRKAAAREAIRGHLGEGKPAAEVPAARHWLFDREAVRQIAVVQPIVYAHESMFGGIEVFGPGRIAIRLPAPAGGTELMFCSFALSGFREFARNVAELYGIERLGEDVGVPLTDSYTDLKCHYSEEPVRALERVEFYQADPQIKLKIVGRKCEGCGLVVSEDSRKKEKIGGPAGKTIAKAKCPKCQKRFGSISLYDIEQAEPPRTEDSADAAETAEAPQAAAAT